jgi:hypothetical protein
MGFIFHIHRVTNVIKIAYAPFTDCWWPGGHKEMKCTIFDTSNMIGRKKGYYPYLSYH